MTDGKNSKIEKYLETYLTPPPVQDAGAAETDAQLHSLIMSLSEIIGTSGAGSVIDIGCGNGTLLERLSDLPTFLESSWLYVGVDSDENLDMVQRLARTKKLNRRTEFSTLEEFYSDWPSVPALHVAFCRNVLHELTIAQTSDLLLHVAKHLGQSGRLVLQDLMNFSEGERHNACWFPDELVVVLEEHGFSTIKKFVFPSRAGNLWFNILANGPASTDMDGLESFGSIRNARSRQWQAWAAIDKEADAVDADQRTVLETIDLDLQLAALTRQLLDAGLHPQLNPALEKKLRSRAVASKIHSFVTGGRLVSQDISPTVHFRERGEQLTKMESFLRSQDTVAIVYGGIGTGKTSFVTHLLSMRSYEKSVVIIDGRQMTDLWVFVESFFAQLGLRLAPEVLSSLRDLGWGALEIPWRQFLNRFGGQFVLVIDNFHHALDSNGELQDSNLATALTLLVGGKKSKVVLVQNQREPARVVSEQWQLLNPPTVQIGRYAAVETVVNILDDRLDRSKLGLAQYPEKLLRAIDRHPLAAKLAADVLFAHGTEVLDDDRFHSEVEEKLFLELWRRLVNEECRDAVHAAAAIRIAVPRKMLERLSTTESVAAAISTSAINIEVDRQWKEMLACLALFKRNSGEQRGDAAMHKDIARAFLNIYKQDDDPKWIRESYYHRIISGEKLGKGLNRYYIREIIASGHYCFRIRDYRQALELYETAANLGSVPEDVQMRYASCLVRSENRRSEGEKEYQRLIEKYRNNKGIKQSYVAALLGAGDVDQAKTKYDLYIEGDPDPRWRSMLGRIQFGLHQYPEAEKIFRGLIGAEKIPEPWLYAQLARSLLYQGAVADALAEVSRALALHPTHPELLGLKGAVHERLRQADEALKILEPLFAEFPERAEVALTLAKIFGRNLEQRFKLRGVFDRARRHAKQDEPLLLILEAEVLKGENRSQAAVDLLQKTANRDQHTLGMYFECAYHAALQKEADNRKMAAAQALKVQVPQRLVHNVPLLVNRARLAVLADDRSIFSSTLERLGKSRIEKFELDGLQKLWDSR